MTDLLLSAARVGSRIVDVRITDGIITSIGAPGQAVGSAQRVDLEGRWLGAGLWDEHVHFTQWAMASARLDLSGATSARHAAELAGAAPGFPIVGGGFRDGLWPDLPTREVLDATTGGTPAVLVSADLHSVWMNGAALAMFGFGGHPTGLVREADAFAVLERLGTTPVETVDRWARAAAQQAARRGVVGIVDYEMAWNLLEWERRVAAGADSLRVDVGVYPQHLDRAIAQGVRTGDRHGELISVGRLKVLTDGSLNTRTAATDHPYEDGSHGLLTVPFDELVPLLRRAHAAGLSAAVHAIGDRANSLALDAFEAVGRPPGPADRIEHAQLLSDSDLPRFAALGVTASVQPEHAMDDRDVADRHWRAHTARLYPFRSLLAAGAELRFGSDAPVAPLDPWLAIAAAVSRERDGRESWHPEQRIGIVDALAASTRTTVAVGQPADLIVTDADPLTADSETLRRMPVVATMLGGRFTHRAV
jgi:predicted amidohydrolase YtcJ